MIEEMRVKQWQDENPHINFKFWLMDKLDAAESDNAGLRGTLRDEILRAEAAEARAAQAETECDALAQKLAEIKSILAGGRTVGGDAEQAYRDAEEIAEDGAESYKAMTP